jgi:hypothetical protein
MRHRRSTEAILAQRSQINTPTVDGDLRRRAGVGSPLFLAVRHGSPSKSFLATRRVNARGLRGRGNGLGACRPWAGGDAGSEYIILVSPARQNMPAAKYFLVKIQKKSKFFYGKKFVFSRQG